MLIEYGKLTTGYLHDSGINLVISCTLHERILKKLGDPKRFIQYEKLFIARDKTVFIDIPKEWLD